MSEAKKFMGAVSLATVEIALIVNEASSNTPPGGMSDGDEATTMTALPCWLATAIEVFSTGVDKLGLVAVISLARLIFAGSKVNTVLVKPTFLVPLSAMILTVESGGKFTCPGEKDKTTSPVTGGVAVTPPVIGGVAVTVTFCPFRVIERGIAPSVNI